MLDDVSIFAEPSSFFCNRCFQEQFRTFWIVVWIVEMQLLHVAVLSSAYDHQGISIWRCRGRNLNFTSAGAKISYDMELKNWSNHGLSWNRCIDSGILSHEEVCLLCMLEFDLQNHHLRLRRFCSTFQQRLVSRMTQTFVNWISFSSVSKFRRCSRNVFPDTGLSLLRVCTKE